MAGAPPATRTIERVRSELGWEFIQIYGLTETAPLLTFNRMRSEWADLEPRQQARNLGRAGTPALGVRLAVDETGEVLAQSNHNLLGLLGQPGGDGPRAGRRLVPHRRRRHVRPTVT